MSVAASKYAQCVGTAKDAEAKLILRCAERASKRLKKEWFHGLDFNEVLRWMDECACADQPGDGESFVYQMVVRRDSFPCPSPCAYICRSCCAYHWGLSSRHAFLCADCDRKGYVFAVVDRRPSLELNGKPVPLWSGVPYEDVDVHVPDGVSCEELRPDEPWLRCADDEWLRGRPMLDVASTSSWHPQGRPVLDVAREAA